MSYVSSAAEKKGRNNHIHTRTGFIRIITIVNYHLSRFGLNGFCELLTHYLYFHKIIRKKTLPENNIFKYLYLNQS